MASKSKDTIEAIAPIAKWLVGGAIVYFGVLRPIMKKTGLIETAESRKQDKQLEQDEQADAWNTSWWSRTSAAGVPNILATNPHKYATAARVQANEETSIFVVHSFTADSAAISSSVVHR